MKKSIPKIVIIGAGLTGLSLAYFLEEENKKDYILLEGSSEIGGLCKSIRKNGFVFDLAPHLLHLKNPEIIELVKKLLGDELTLNTRKAGIVFGGKIIPYPFQYNLYHLDEEIKKECLDGAIEANKKFSEEKESDNFGEWIKMTFGEGIAKYFMTPYNKKYYCVDPNELTMDFFKKYIPKTRFEEIRQGAISDMSDSKAGYFHEFYYIKSGGIDYLPKAMAKGVQNIRLDEKVIRIDLDKKIVFTENSEYNYTNLVSTIPINKLIQLMGRVPDEIKIAREKLRCNSISLVFLGINRPKISDHHWLYLPQEDILPFRITFHKNLSENMVPTNMSSICAEYSYLGDKKFTDDEIIEKTIDDLIKIGVIKNKEEIIFKDSIDLPYAYPIFDLNRKENLKLIKDYLDKHEIISIGRFGTWEYSPMEDGIIQSKHAVSRLIS